MMMIMKCGMGAAPRKINFYPRICLHFFCWVCPSNFYVLTFTITKQQNTMGSYNKFYAYRKSVSTIGITWNLRMERILLFVFYFCFIARNRIKIYCDDEHFHSCMYYLVSRCGHPPGQPHFMIGLLFFWPKP